MKGGAKTIEWQKKIRGVSFSQDKFLGLSQYAEVQRQLSFDDHALALCILAPLNIWDKVEELGKRSETFTRILQGQKSLQ